VSSSAALPTVLYCTVGRVADELTPLQTISMLSKCSIIGRMIKSNDLSLIDYFIVIKYRYHQVIY